MFYAQSVALAAEADVWRRDTVNKMIKPVNFLPELDERGQPFQSCPVTFAHPQLVIDALPPVRYTAYAVVLVLNRARRLLLIPIGIQFC